MEISRDENKDLFKKIQQISIEESKMIEEVECSEFKRKQYVLMKISSEFAALRKVAASTLIIIKRYRSIIRNHCIRREVVDEEINKSVANLNIALVGIPDDQMQIINRVFADLKNKLLEEDKDVRG